MRPSLAPFLVLLAVSLGGCGRSRPASPGHDSPSSPYALAKDPSLGGALTVLDARKAAPRADVVVVGRVREVAGGFAAFTLVDASLAYCGARAGEEKSCRTPWDYCCQTDEEIAANSLPVAVRREGGVVPLARIPEIRLLDMVAVRGALVKDAQGQVTLEATGWFPRERPELPETVEFPE